MRRSRNVLYYGSEDRLVEPVRLEAGPLALELEMTSGFARYISFEGLEVLRGIYVAVRDRNWDTVLPRLERFQLESYTGGFQVRMEFHCLRGEIDFYWVGYLTAGSDGTLTYRMEGKARTSFLRNRIGFNVLHPTSCAGRPCRVLTTSGRTYESRFPTSIEPHQPFLDLRSLAHQVEPGVWAEVSFEGDIFETEDQRNWTDASFKTYSTPLSLPFPVKVEAGTSIVQAVRLRIEQTDTKRSVTRLSSSPRQPAKGGIPLIAVDDRIRTPLPTLGLGWSPQTAQLPSRDRELLQQARPHHLRVDLPLQESSWEQRLRAADADARDIGASLEIAVFLDGDQNIARRALEQLAARVKSLRPPIARWFIFHNREKSTAPVWAALAREILTQAGPEVPIGIGSNAYFTELNRGRPPDGSADILCYSLNPQVHAFDHRSLVETLQAQATTVESARRFAGSASIAVSPITLKPRFNPNATGPEPETPPDQLPPQVDPRQMSLFGAVWTLGSLKYLSEAGAHSLTYYETCGWRGILQGPWSPPLPEKFPARAGEVFPLYHVFCDVTEMRQGQVLKSTSTHPLQVVGMTIRRERRLRILVANLQAHPLVAFLEYAGLPQLLSLRYLDESRVEEAMADPVGYRRDPGTEIIQRDGQLLLAIPPLGIARIDGEVMA